MFPGEFTMLKDEALGTKSNRIRGLKNGSQAYCFQMLVGLSGQGGEGSSRTILFGFICRDIFESSLSFGQNRLFTGEAECSESLKVLSSLI